MPTIIGGYLQPNLVSLARHVDPILANALRNAPPSDLFNQLAHTFSPSEVTVNDIGGDRPYIRLEASDYEAQVRQWDGEREMENGGAIDTWDVFVYDYAITETLHRSALDTRRLMPAQTALTADRIFNKFVEAWSRGKLPQTYQVLRDNTALCYDGQPLISASHTHLDKDSTAFSNLKVLGTDTGFAARGTAAAPTEWELHLELQQARLDCRDNRLRATSELRPHEVRERGTVIANSLAIYATFVNLLEDEEIPNAAGDLVKNPDRGTFDLVEDSNPAAGTGNYWTWVPRRQSGEGFEARPLVHCEVEMPPGIDADLSKAFSQKVVPVGIDGKWAVGVGWPQMILQVRDS